MEFYPKKSKAKEIKMIKNTFEIKFFERFLFKTLLTPYDATKACCIEIFSTLIIQRRTNLLRDQKKSYCLEPKITHQNCF